MSIEIISELSAPAKEKGDLLEELASHLLLAQGYEVEREVRKTGVELDLLCRHKANKNKKLYVECKAYRDGKNLDAPIIFKLLGIKDFNKYEEAWLVCTCELGKDAKGLADELESAGRTDVSIYTPTRLITSLVDAHVIKSADVANHSASKILKSASLPIPVLLVTPIGLYWAYRHKLGSKDNGVLVIDARSGECVTDISTLTDLQGYDSSFHGLEFIHPYPVTNGSDAGIFKFRLDQEYVNSIIDTGVMYTHPHKRVLDKDDLFVFPDLQLVNEDDKVSSSILMTLTGEHRKNVIFGDELSGKTTLAQKFQRTYVQAGYIPVYINASNINSSSTEKFYRTVSRYIKAQYANVTDEAINAIDKSTIVIIVDDYQNIKLNKNAASQFFINIDEEYENIFWLINTRQELELLANEILSTKLVNYTLYRIKELGFKLRDDLIKTWISIGRTDTIQDAEKHKQVIEIAEIINSTVGRNYIPTYPIYVLTLLQSFEASTVKSLQGSAYAEFYNYLITHALGTVGVKAAELDLYYSLLSDLSYHFFVNSERDISESSLNRFYDEFCSRKMVDRKFEKTKAVLLHSKILKSENEIYWFNHSYIYYFFVGKYLSENSQREEVKEKIIALTKRLYLTEIANIVVFLVHFSKDPFVLDNILAEARKIFSEVGLATFGKDEFTNINRLVEKELKIVLEDKRPEDRRVKELELKDDINDKLPKTCEENVDYNSDIKELDVFGQINLAFKIIEILGQITKNYYGSLDGEIKIQLLEETYNLGLRSLNRLMTAFDEYTGLLEKEISKIIQERKLISDSEVKILSNRLIFEFATMISFGFVAKVANSVASKELSAIYDAVYEKDPLISKQMINIAVDLDFFNGLDANKVVKIASDVRNNNIASLLLKILVTRHLYKFSIAFDKKQKVCEQLNIGINNQVKMLSQTK